MKNYPGRMGHKQYARILAEITAQPMTADQLAEKTGKGKASLREVLWRLEQMGEAHVTGWVPPIKKRSIMSAVFAAGPGESVPYPRSLNRPAPGSTLAIANPRPELMAFCHVLRVLRDGATRADLREETGIAPMRLSLLIRELRRLNLARICRWQIRPDGQGMPAQVFKLGGGSDAPRPKTLTEKEKQTRYKTRLRARVATQRVLDAIQGKGKIQAYGVQCYALGDVA